MGFKYFQVLSRRALILLACYSLVPALSAEPLDPSAESLDPSAESLSQLAQAGPRVSTLHDADACSSKSADACSSKSIPNCSVFHALIDFHQRVLSPADGPRSHFAPVSSTYARGALFRFGFAGLTLVFDRLLRENDQLWAYKVERQGDESFAKLDPVPLADLK